MEEYSVIESREGHVLSYHDITLIILRRNFYRLPGL